jgi:PTH1 family peptidyl-tRNA hydrolase
MKLIVGLGNPGQSYAGNRHNVGFLCLNYFANIQSIHFNEKCCKAHTGLGEVTGTEVILARPQTYMNRSGQSVSLLVNKFNISHNDLLVIHDDLDLPLGKIRIRGGGSSGGHKGIDSIITELGTSDFIRVRIGIGRPAVDDGLAEFNDNDIKTYVLSDFTLAEKQAIAPVFLIASEAILCLLNEGLIATMNRYN